MKVVELGLRLNAAVEKIREAYYKIIAIDEGLADRLWDIAKDIENIEVEVVREEKK